MGPSKALVATAFVALPLALLAGGVGPLTTFVNGETADALAVNANFSQLRATIDELASGTPVALTDAATVAWDAGSGSVYEVTLAGNRSLANATNQVKGRRYTLFVTQDGVGARTLSFGSDYRFTGATPALAGTANASTIFEFISDGNLLHSTSVHYPTPNCGEDAARAAFSCKAIRDDCGATTSASAWITAGGGTAFRTYCDHETDSGGWSLFAKNADGQFYSWPEWQGGSSNITDLTNGNFGSKAYFQIDAYDGFGTGQVTLRQLTDDSKKGFWVLTGVTSVSNRIQDLKCNTGSWTNITYYFNSLGSTPYNSFDPTGSSCGTDHMIGSNRVVGTPPSTMHLGSGGYGSYTGVNGCYNGNEGSGGSWDNDCTLWIRED